MTVDQQHPVRTFVLVPERDLGHAIADKLREEPSIRVIGVSTNPDRDAFWIYDADPDVIIADFQAGGLDFLFTDRLPPGEHRVVFFAPRSEAGCDAWNRLIDEPQTIKSIAMRKWAHKGQT